MKEKIYTIPVNDAFDKDCECPLCAMYQELENNAVEYAMGPSYMEDDIRAEAFEKDLCCRKPSGICTGDEDTYGQGD